MGEALGVSIANKISIGLLYLIFFVYGNFLYDHMVEVPAARTTRYEHSAKEINNEEMKDDDLETDGPNVDFRMSVSSADREQDVAEPTDQIPLIEAQNGKLQYNIGGMDVVEVLSSSVQPLLPISTQGDKLVSEVQKWPTFKKRHFLEDVDHLLENDYSESIQKLKIIMNKVELTDGKKIKDFLKVSHKKEWQGNTVLIKMIRNAFVHYCEHQDIGSHPDTIFERIEKVAPRIVPEIMYPLIKLCEDGGRRCYMYNYTSLYEYIDALVGPTLEKGLEEVGPAVQHNSVGETSLSKSVRPVHSTIEEIDTEDRTDPLGTEVAELVPTTSCLPPAGLIETDRDKVEWDKVLNEVQKWPISKKRRIFEDVNTVLENDYSEPIQMLKSEMNKHEFTYATESRGLLKVSHQQERQGKTFIIKKIRNSFVHYGDGSHPNKTFERIEKVSPQIVSEIMYPIIMLCKDIMYRRYIYNYTSLREYIDVLVGPALEKGQQEVGPAVQHNSIEKQNFRDFYDMDLSKETRQEINAREYEYPSRLQSLIIQKIKEKKDVTIVAQAGSGKTTAIVIAMLQNLKPSHRSHRCLAIVLTRKLRAQKFQHELEAFACNMGINFYTCTRDNDLQKLQSSTVLIGTPGEVTSVLNKKLLDPGSVRMLVIDKADVTLSGLLEHNVHNVLTQMPKNAQKIVCSVTLTDKIQTIETKFMKEPFQIREELTFDAIQQYFTRSEKEMKCSTLLDLFEKWSIYQAVIFCNRSDTVDWLTKELSSQDFTVSKLGQDPRYFNSGSSRVLVTTDTDLCDIDTRNVSHVINFDLPSKNESSIYIDRIRLLKRFGRKGMVISLVSKGDDKMILCYIERFCQTRIDNMNDKMNVDFAT